MNKRTKRIIIFAFCVILYLVPVISIGQSYLLASYEDNPRNEFEYVYLKLIDLETATIRDSLLLSDDGTIYTPTPIKLTVKDSSYFLTFISKGEFDKNTYVGNCRIYWWITSGANHINLIKCDSLLNASMGSPDIYEDKPFFYFGIRNEKTRKPLLKDGLYDLDSNFNFHQVSPSKVEKPSLHLVNQGSYHQIDNLNEPNIWNLYSAIGGDGQFVILRVNTFNDTIVDSLRLSAPFKMSKVSAFHPSTGKLYCFFLNYVYKCRSEDLNKVYGQDWGSPEVVIYDPHTLVELDRIKIADCTEEDYAGMAFGRAEIVGDFIVYYYSDSEGIEQFEPAMLFIFDTRTNEARWLRVGWR
jgi:hypothetical protein